MTESVRTALLIIDMQNDFVLPGARLRVAGALPTVAAIMKVQSEFHARKWPVFFVVREYRADGSDIELTRWHDFLHKRKCVVPGTPGCELVQGLHLAPGDYRLVKNRFSAFMNTELDFMLRRLNVARIAVCGTQYPNCIRATVFDGVSYGYEVAVLTDATSAQTPDVAEANLRDMRNIGVRCCGSDEFFEKP